MKRLFETITPDINPNVRILSNSSNELMLKFTNISLVLLRQGNLIKRCKLLLYATLKCLKPFWCSQTT